MPEKVTERERERERERIERERERDLILSQRERERERERAASRRTEAMRFLGELAQARNDGIDIERANTTWSTRRPSFTSYRNHARPDNKRDRSALAGGAVGGRRVAIEIERAIKKNASF
jgi:hypothetical protein